MLWRRPFCTSWTSWICVGLLWFRCVAAMDSLSMRFKLRPAGVEGPVSLFYRIPTASVAFFVKSSLRWKRFYKGVKVNKVSLCTFRHHSSRGSQFIRTREPQWSPSSGQQGILRAQFPGHLSYRHRHQPGEHLEDTHLARQQGY